MSCPVFINDSLDATLTLVQCGTTTPLDISTASTLEIVFRGRGVRLVKTATLVTDGTDGQLTASVDANELSEAGRWEMQAHVVIPGSPNLVYHGDKVPFEVEEIL